jgi:predicted amidohydrolase
MQNIAMKDLSITIIQTKLFWENVDSNLEWFEKKLNSVAAGTTDLIVLPEMFSTGFTMKPETVAEPADGKSFRWLKEKAKEKKCVITGSVSVEENGKYYNRLFWMRPDGSFSTYNKRHLFRFAGEHEHYTAGNKRIIEEINGWRICPLICYDLRFPVWARNRSDYDVLLYTANWPERRSFAWKHLLIARAIENLSYVVGVNRIGNDGNGISHSGDSVVLDFLGAPISKTKPNEDSAETVTLQYQPLVDFRKAFPAFSDADFFKIE